VRGTITGLDRLLGSSTGACCRRMPSPHAGPAPRRGYYRPQKFHRYLGQRRLLLTVGAPSPSMTRPEETQRQLIWLNCSLSRVLGLPSTLAALTRKYTKTVGGTGMRLWWVVYISLWAGRPVFCTVQFAHRHILSHFLEASYTVSVLEPTRKSIARSGHGVTA